MKKRLAVVGTGMAGMSAAYFLKDHYDITVFEKNDYIGGHTNTVYVEEEGKRLPIDTGFMVFNEHTYPNMCRLFKKIGAPYHDTDMSFSIYDAARAFEYNGSSFNDLFSQRKNILSPRFWRMLADIGRFGKRVPKYLTDAGYLNISLGELIEKEKLGDAFTHDYLLPMTSAVWSTPHHEMLLFPARSMVRFLYNHGLTGMDTQHQWKTVQAGSETYKQILIKEFKDRIKVSHPVMAAWREGNEGVLKFKDGHEERFDVVVFASHADETRELIHDKSAQESELLAPFNYQPNDAWLHTDDSLMPKLKKNWSSWNQVHREGERFTIYYMNRLQPISKKVNYFININGTRFIDEKKVIKKISYHHPVFNLKTEAAQAQFPALNAASPIFKYCGAWQRYGFHEDALVSSVNLCEQMLGRPVL
jgi:predicted NAD/FAD-binding protein